MEGDRVGRLRTDVDWLLPRCTVEQIRDRADRRRPFWRDTDGRLKAKIRVRDGQSRLVARIIRLRRHRTSFTLRARLTQEGTGVRLQGHVPRADITAVALGFALQGMFVGLAVGAAATRSLLDTLTLVFVAMAAAVGWTSRGLIGRARDGYRRELLELEGKVRSRFSGEPVPGRPWVPEPLEGTGYQPFKPQPMVRLGRRRR